jgi:predicted MPP superfamily phosphohydrolase
MLFHLETRILLVALVLHAPQAYWAYRFWKGTGARKWLRWLGLAALVVLQIPWFTLFFGRSTWGIPIPDSGLAPLRMISALWALGALAAFLLLAAFRLARMAWARFVPRESTPFDPERRRLMEAATTGIGLAPWVMVAYGIGAARFAHRVERVSVPIADLPERFEGFRIVQLTDIHVSEDVPPSLIERFVEVASDLDADLGVLTGDYLAFDQWGLDECVAALSQIRTRAGVIGCLGNHEIHTEASEKITAAFGRRGVDILRGEGRDIEREGGSVRIVGVDYQRSRHAPLREVERWMSSEAPNLLLSHNPNVFPHAAELGFDLTLAGHTHGGQVRVEILEREISPSLFMSPFVQGLYRIGSSRLYVSQGVGTSGLPIRLGAPPEITLITLRRA